MNYKIEVAICTFNGKDYVKQQIESILNQTLKVNLISIYDDQSSDNTLEIIEKIRQSYLGKVEIKVVRNKQNLGYIKNFIQAITKSSHDFLFFSDQDDIWNKQKVEKIINKFLEEKVNKPTLVFSNASIVDSNGNTNGKNLWDELKFSNENLKSELFFRNVITGATAAINKELVNLIKKAYISDSVPHDYSIAILALAEGRIIGISENLTSYRIHNNNLIGISPKGLKKIFNIFFSTNGLYISQEIHRMQSFIKMLNSINSSDHMNYYYKKIQIYKELNAKLFIYCPYICIKNKKFFRSWKTIIKLTYASFRKDILALGHVR